MKTEVKTKSIALGTRVSPATWEMIQEVIAVDLHVSESEFVRDAIIDYIRLNWPHVFQKYSGRVVGGKKRIK